MLLYYQLVITQEMVELYLVSVVFHLFLELSTDDSELALKILIKLRPVCMGMSDYLGRR